jgi:hypothetical protein
LFVFIEFLLWLERRDTRRDAPSRTDAIAGSVILLINSAVMISSLASCSAGSGARQTPTVPGLITFQES